MLESDKPVTAEKRTNNTRVLVTVSGRLVPIDLPPIFRGTFRSPRGSAQLRYLGKVS